MGIVRGGWIAGLGLLLGCGVAPTQLPGGGGGGTSATGGSTEADTDPVGTAATTDGSGSASGTGGGGGSSSDGGATRGAQPGSSSSSSSGEDETSATSSTTDEGDERGEESSGAPSPSCDELYDTAPGYELCMETRDECHFNANTAGGNCNEMCTSLGGTCLAAFDNGTACEILRPNTDTCETDRSTEICVCNK